MSIIKFKKNKVLHKRLSIVVALTWILSSILLVSGSIYFAYFYYRYTQEEKKADSKYNLLAIVQSSHSNEYLQSEYLAEQLGLSVDSPTNLFSFDCKRGEQQLIRSPLINKASIHKISPGTLFIEYSIRIPIAYLGDLTNTAIDENGVLIPFRPFFTPKSLPTIRLGATFFKPWEKGHYWGHSVKSNEFSLAKKIIDFFEKENCGYLKVVDLKRIKSSSLGSREIVITIDDSRKRFIRLPVEKTMKSLEDYQLLHHSLLRKMLVTPEVIDLRLNHQALLYRS
ncbi:MAG: FtsQ-type POTRA domain-containing protein [Chlamydiota bacterium]